jgi:hypothetical protein
LFKFIVENANDELLYVIRCPSLDKIILFKLSKLPFELSILLLFLLLETFGEFDADE